MYGNKLGNLIRRNGKIPGKTQAIPKLTQVEIENLTRRITNKEICRSNF